MIGAAALAALHVVLWHPYRAAEEQALEQAARVYERAHPGVTVEVVAVPYDAYAYKLEAAIPRGNGPDLFVGKQDSVGEWARTELVRPIDERALAPGELAQFLDGTVEPLELGHLPFRKKTFEDYVGERGLKKNGKKKWTKAVFAAVEQLSAAMEPDEIVLGGGGVDELDELPDGCRRGENENAFLGGFRLWDPDWLSHLQ